ncbi:uncharacterized protein DUF4124 [Alteromonadaceae bacterium 2753L.S.0a.02]|nr:uncharacterized protein DUF4124 [Alteromonadaceae bacterium 2753L.S.0a.02]
MVSKLVIKLIVMVIVMLGISNYVLYIMTGKTPFSSDSLPSISAPKLSDLKPKLPAGKDKVYKWTDDKGVVHYSSEAPQQTTEATETLEVDPNTNVIQGIEVPTEEKTETVQAPPPQPSLHNPYSQEGVQKLMDDARNVQKLLDDRYEQQKKIMGDK